MKYKNRPLHISCDGGAATGKSTGARMIAKKYKLKFLSSGLLYRYASFLILKFRPKNKLLFLKKNFEKLNYKRLEKINLHKPAISEYSSIIAKNNKIRKILKKYQITFSKIRRGKTRDDAGRRGPTRHDATQRDATRRDTTRRDATRRDATRRDMS